MPPSAATQVSTSAPIAFTFFGVAETVLTEFSFNPGPVAFGFAEGEQVTAHLRLSGDTAAAVTAAVGGGSVTIAVDLDEVDLTLPIPVHRGWEERHINSQISIAIDDPAQPPATLDFQLGTTEVFPDGPNGNVDQSSYGIFIDGDDDSDAALNGLWIPDGLDLTRVYGTTGDDVLRGTGDHNAIWGLDGDDHIMVKAGRGFAWVGFGDDTIKGNNGDDALIGWAGDDKILGRRGDDRLFGNEGNDLLRGEPGDDWIDGGFGNDSLKGGSGDDQLMGGEGDDILIANDGRDSLAGGNGHDFLDGGSGDDVLRDFLGNDTMDGGPGDDLFLVNAELNGVDTILGFLTGAGSDDVMRIENFAGGFADLVASAYDTSDGAVFVTNQFSGSFYGLVFAGREVADFHSDDFVLV